jgi:hypothetical protein
MGGQYESAGQDDPLKGVIRATVTVAGGPVPLQLVFLPLTFTNAIFQQVDTLSIMNHTAPIVRWDMLVLLKLYAGEPQDVLDARQILKVRQPSSVEMDKIKSFGNRVGSD